MLERVARQLESVEARYEELSVQITLPEVINDTARFQKLMREHSDIAELAEFARGFRKLREDIESAREMLAQDDADLAEMAREELEALEPQMEEKAQEARILLLPKDPDDNRNAIIEVRAGAGGDEAGLFGAELVRMYQHYAEKHGWKVEMTDEGETEIGGIKEAVMLVQGKGVFAKLKYESGVHRVQRVPVTESGGRIHTSTATVAVLPEAEDVEVDIQPNDLRIDTYRASGAGGQHVNRTDSAVRITHIPTGIVVQCQNERSQIQNRETCMRVLRARLIERQEQERQEQMSELKGEMKKIEWGSQIRSYVFQPYTMVKDHRTGHESGNIAEVMDGKLEDFVIAYLQKM